MRWTLEQSVSVRPDLMNSNDYEKCGSKLHKLMEWVPTAYSHWHSDIGLKIHAYDVATDDDHHDLIVVE